MRLLTSLERADRSGRLHHNFFPDYFYYFPIYCKSLSFLKYVVNSRTGINLKSMSCEIYVSHKMSETIYIETLSLSSSCVALLCTLRFKRKITHDIKMKACTLHHSYPHESDFFTAVV